VLFLQAVNTENEEPHKFQITAAFF